jgi:molybdopterin/thiamine biosynthesis adenylyltransferase
LKPDKISLSLSEQDFGQLQTRLLTSDGNENFAVAFCGTASGDRWQRILVRELWHAPPEAYRKRQSFYLEIEPRYLDSVVTHALSTRVSPVLIHSHPSAKIAEYSASDDYGESRLLAVLQDLLPGLHPASVLIAETDIAGRILNRTRSGFQKMDFIDVRGVASAFFGATQSLAPNDLAPWDRQICGFGVVGQSRIGRLQVGVIGLGGTGSAVAEQLGRVGVQHIILVDPDRMEPSNLSRVWGSTHRDSAKRAYKTKVLERTLKAIGGIEVQAVEDSVVRQSVLQVLRRCDVIFGCTDNHLSRAVLNRLAYQYLIPVVDMGTRLDARTSGTIDAAAGRVTLVGPGLACLRCSYHIDPTRIREESLPAEEREKLAREGYVQGAPDPAPAVISLNSTIAGMAVTAGLSMFVNLSGAPPAIDQIFDATRGVLFSVIPRHEPTCDICSASGLKGLGDLQMVSAYA